MLFPNQFVNSRLLVDTEQDVVLAPTAAVQRGPDSTFAYVVKSDNTVRVKNVTTGAAEAGQTVITSGLDSDEVVVVDGVDKLEPGKQVEAPRCDSAGSRPAAPATHLRKAETGTQARVPMSPSRPFILRPVATVLLMAAILLVGGVAYLPAAGLRAAAGGLPDDSGADVLSGGQPRRDGFVGDRALGAAIRPGAGPEPDDVDQLRRQLGHHVAVHAAI